MATDPLAWFNADRARARAADDPMANLCTVANVDADNRPQLRTLVLRDVDGVLGIFVNASSPKWPHLQETFALATYWPSVSIQYRLQVRAEALDPDVVAASWMQRPDPPKRMDWLYHLHDAQSREIESREKLLAVLDNLPLETPLRAPPDARGILLKPEHIERLDLTHDNGVHDRQQFRYVDGSWEQTTLIP